MNYAVMRMAGDLVSLLILLAEAALIVTLVLRRLAGEFRIFLLFLAWNITRALFLRWFGGQPDTLPYRDIWMAMEPVNLLMQALVVFEFYRLLFRAYPGIQNFAKVLLFAGSGVALVVMSATLVIDLSHVVWMTGALQGLFIIKQSVSWLFGFLLLITMLFFPRAQSAWNVLLHGWLLTWFFMAAAGGIFGLLNTGVASRVVSVAFLSCQLVCFVLWAVLLRPPYARRTKLTVLRPSRGGILASG